MNVRFLTVAKQELHDAKLYYELEHPGLGKQFEQDVKKSAQRLKSFPKAGSEERGDIRKLLLHRFPFKLLYSIESDHILILAVAHQHRQPDYWTDRIE